MGIDIAAERERAARDRAKAQREAEWQARRSAANKVEAAKSRWICSVCGTPGNPTTYTNGSFVVELFLWVGGIMFIWFFLWPILVPIAYSIWRLASRSKGCGSCRGTMVETDTPVGKELLKRVVAGE